MLDEVVDSENGIYSKKKEKKKKRKTNFDDGNDNSIENKILFERKKN